MTRKSNRLTVGQVCLFGILGAMTFGAKFVMSGLPNIEPVSLMVMLFAVTFGLKALFPIYVYVLMEFLIFPAGVWNLNYLYIWLILAAAAYLMRKMEHPLEWAVLSGVFGLLFGAFCAPVDILIGGSEYALSKWISGIPFDIAHCVGNFIIALLLFVPLRKLLTNLYAKMAR